MQGFGLYAACDILEEVVLLFWGGGWEDHKNNVRCDNNKTDWYKITYWCRKFPSYL